MSQIIIEGAIWVLAIYGLLEIIKSIVYTYMRNINLKSDGIYFIIAAKNQEEKIEGFFRSNVIKNINKNQKDIIVVDLNSKDKTEEIIEKLAQENDLIKVISWKECEKIVEKIEQE